MFFQKYKSQILAILAGLASVGLLNSAMNFIIFQRVHGLIGEKSTIDTITYNRSLLTVVALLLPIVGAMVTGYFSKQKGWLNGILFEVVIKMISIFLISTTFFTPQLLYGTSEPNKLMILIAQKNLIRELISLPVAFFFAAWGGWIGEKIAIGITRSKQTAHK